MKRNLKNLHIVLTYEYVNNLLPQFHELIIIEENK